MTDWRLIASLKHKLETRTGAHMVTVPASWVKELVEKFEQRTTQVEALKEQLGRQARLHHDRMLQRDT